MGIMKFCQVRDLCYLTMLRETHRKTMGIVKFCQVVGTHCIKASGIKTRSLFEAMGPQSSRSPSLR